VQTAWLLDNAGTVYAAALVGGFSAVAAWETFKPLRPHGSTLRSRWTVNIALLLINNAVIHALLPIVGVGAALAAQTRGWGLLPRVGLPPFALAALAVLLLDLVRWQLHRALHRLPWLWRLHQVHHSDIDYDCTVGLRFHPLEALASSAVLVLAVAALGAPPSAVLLSDALTLALGFVAHGNVSLPRRWDRVVRWVLVTPDVHRIHHSCKRSESMSNFASVFSFWDRLFGTFKAAPADGHLAMSMGLRALRDPAQLTLPRLLALPFRHSPRREAERSATEGGRAAG